MEEFASCLPLTLRTICCNLMEPAPLPHAEQGNSKPSLILVFFQHPLLQNITYNLGGAGTKPFVWDFQKPLF